MARDRFARFSNLRKMFYMYLLPTQDCRAGYRLSHILLREDLGKRLIQTHFPGEETEAQKEDLRLYGCLG